MTLVFFASQGKNMELAQRIGDELMSQSKQFELIDLVGLELPLYDERQEEKYKPSEKLEVVLSKMKASSSQVFIAPEYNGSVPPVLNNFIAWTSRASKDWRECFNEKKCLIATHSGGGGAHVLMSMRSQFSFIGMNVLGRQLLTNYNKELSEESLKASVRQL